MEVYRAQLTRVISGPVKLTDQDPLQRSNRINQSAMEEPTAKGTVTSLSSMFSVDDVQKAAKRVQDALLEKQQELERVKEFISDNTNLINLVQKLPEELHHGIMVPFGKAAFFPGRLIHTNEFMVLLGEGYYAERTSKQTVEILKRRGKVLDSQVDSLKAMMKDLQAEASFFDTTASEAAEGLVEIREEYGEENLSERASESGLLKQDSSRLSEADNLKDEDEEYARIMSRLDELEKEELAWEIENGSAESKQNNVAKSDNAKYGDEDNELEEAELAAETENRSDENKQNNAAGSDNENNEDEQANTVSDQFSNQISLDHNLRHSEVFSEEAFVTIESLLPSSNFKLSMSMTSCSGSKRVPLSKFRLQLASETTGIGAQKRYHYPIGPDFCYGSSISSYVWPAFLIWLVA
ncbi:prefoldin chaperone subunit family protein [Citrus sinensis]|uniref:Prefoldin chaperone subunit family protein n=1 Tax=Citrus sinensis TaxID=2711 RepID=A0ACB8N2P3_CITSI|nr:prefoldin chaperone subunit family protein [Citrus sinensis]